MNLQLEIINIERTLHDFGYNEITDIHVDSRLDYKGNLTHILWANLRDDFQKNLPYEDRVQNGLLPFYPEDDHFVIPAYFMSREQRELEVMVKRLGQTKELADAMTSAAGREFARRLEADLSKYKMLGVKDA